MHILHSVVCGGETERRRKRQAQWDFDQQTEIEETGRVFLRKRRQSKQSELSDEERLQRTYGVSLGYECGLARMFEDPETEQLYDMRWMGCNWNKTWTPYDSLDSCKWVACINPPDPPPHTDYGLGL